MTTKNKKLRTEIAKSRINDGLKIGDRVTVQTPTKTFNGVIISEGRRGTWWNVKKDGRKYEAPYHKTYVTAEVKPCKEPGSRRHDPYAKGDEQQEIKKHRDEIREEMNNDPEISGAVKNAMEYFWEKSDELKSDDDV